MNAGQKTQYSGFSEIMRARSLGSGERISFECWGSRGKHAWVGMWYDLEINEWVVSGVEDFWSLMCENI